MSVKQEVHIFEGRLVFSVFNITRRIREDLEADGDLMDVWVEGEISGFKLHPPSGHYYFSLKDDNAQISCACFRNMASGIPALKTAKDGVKVLVRGTISVYEARGQYNLKVKDVRILGKGELYILYEELKKKLEQEGLFGDEKKKPIPKFPSTIGIVTSESGAAFQDILNVLSRRYPLAHILLAHAKVQGEGAADEIKKAIETLDTSGRTDVIIVSRGGGSMEDLWCFNEEPVARAIFASRTPIISAVGHEVDYTIADFVADIRAPTPSAAAEIVVPDMADLLNTVEEWDKRITSLVLGMLESDKDALRSLEERLASRSPFALVEQGNIRCDELEERLDRVIRNILQDLDQNLDAWNVRLENAAVPSTLARGYALAKDPKGALIKDTRGVGEGEEIILMFKDGEVRVKVLKVTRGDEKDE